MSQVGIKPLVQWAGRLAPHAWGAWLIACGAVPLVAQDKLAPASSPEHLIVVIGAAGSQEYAGEFVEWSQPWRKLANRKQWQLTVIGDDSNSDDSKGDDSNGAEDAKSPSTHHQVLQQAVAAQRDAQQRLWIVFLGHGTFTGNVAKFNLAGPDVSSQELSTWLKACPSPVIIVNCSSSSAPFLQELAGRGRIVVTATRAGSEINFSRFGKYLSQTLSDLSADIDHDQEVSLLEAFLAASAQTERFYREESRLATEHALLEDNADKAGVSSDFFRGIRPIKSGAQGKAVDGAAAGRVILYSSPNAPQFTPELAAQRAQIEQELDTLRSKKANLAEVDFYAELERLLLQLSVIYDKAEAQ